MNQARLDLEIIDPGSIHWSPKQDITIHELALCLPVVCRLHACSDYNQAAALLWGLPAATKRHFYYRFKKA